MQNKFLATGAILAAAAVATGAFGAHALSNIVNEKAMHTWETAVLYHIFHALALLLCGVLLQQQPCKKLVQAGWFFSIGLALFSGSLYAMVLLQAGGAASFRWLGAITPLGGFSFIIGWMLLAVSVAKSKR